MAELKGYTIILQATENGVPLYTNLGFQEAGALHQHQGPVPEVPLPDLLPTERIAPLVSSEASIAEIYSRASGADKSALVGKLLANDKGVVLTRGNFLRGFAMLRRFGRGWCIAPVIAADAGATKALILHWLRENIGKLTRIDMPGEIGLSAWLTELGLPCVDIARTMAHGPSPKTADDFRVFAATAQALG
jgi:hypothetical protein